MPLIKNPVLAIFFLALSLPLKSQKNDSTFLKKDSNDNHIAYTLTPVSAKAGKFKPYIVPAAMFAYGLTSLISDPLKDADEYFQQKIWTDNPHQLIHLDNYLQYAPAAAVYILNIAGIKGENNLRDRTFIYLISTAFHASATTSLKHLTKRERPDGSSLSFPSGHTAEAFASAEFLRQEYKNVSQWYGIAGYVTATATGVLRMYNNRHWLSDVVAGAGIGIASTKLAYLVYPAIKKWLFKSKEPHAMVVPYYQNSTAGFSMRYIFN